MTIDAQEWMWELNGAGDAGAIWIDHAESAKRRAPAVDAGFASGTWVLRLTLPDDLGDVEESFDPLFILMGLSDSGRRLEAKTAEAVALCRRRGRSWREIGLALGVTKQSAHQRFGGHESSEIGSDGGFG